MFQTTITSLKSSILSHYVLTSISNEMILLFPRWNTFLRVFISHATSNYTKKKLQKEIKKAFRYDFPSLPSCFHLL